MNTIALHVIPTTVLAARHLSYAKPSAIAQMTGQTAGVVVLWFVIVPVILLITVVRAARSLARLIVEFLHVATTVATVLFGMIIFVVMIIVLSIAH
jgi:hypothetical protein